MGIGVVVPWLRQARWGERSAYSPHATKGLGSEPVGRTGEGLAEPGGDPKGVQQLAVQREQREEEGLSGRPDRSGRLRSRRGSYEKGRARGRDSLLAGTHGCFAGADRCALIRRNGADR